MPNDEQQRLTEADTGARPWRRWGPYVSERQWGTVREDYSAGGDAWNALTHEHARSQAYRWGEDGLAGFCDHHQILCLGLALWNGRDAILKERLFGLANAQGNHGEDVKEIYHYLDATPTYSYARMLYKYPQAAFPYADLVAENGRRGRDRPEYELIDTGVFDDDRYFDVVVEYAKADAEDILMRITATNRGPQAARLVVLPQVWFRNTWSWFDGAPRPSLRGLGAADVVIEHATLGRFALQYEQPGDVVFCENDTNAAAVYGTPATAGYVKDAFHAHVVHGDAATVNPARTGTKAAGVHVLDLAAGASACVRVRLHPGDRRPDAFADFDGIVARRLADADAFYDDIQRGIANEELRRVQRQALAGMLWSKQYYSYDVTQWLAGDPVPPRPPVSRAQGRNHNWGHFHADDVIAVPDKWEYPWFAAWDWAFHCVTLALVDPEYAKEQAVLLCQSWYMHPNGQLPAYEWNFGDVNPPVNAWAALEVYEIDRRRTGHGDRRFLEKIFVKLLLNFTWWVNRQDPEGRNVFEGGFLGLDNIGPFDRDAPVPRGGRLTQSDGTSWMAMFCLNMLRIALELAKEDSAYVDIATKFFAHYLLIAGAMTNLGGRALGLWDDEDAFFYDWVVPPEGDAFPLRVRSIVGVIPLFAVEVLHSELLDLVHRDPDLAGRFDWFMRNRTELTDLVADWNAQGSGGCRLLAITRAFRMKAVLRRLLDEAEFLSPHGVRALSRIYRDHPFVFAADGLRAQLDYEPAESRSGMFGGNSNWRGPVWFPVNFLLITSLRKFAKYYGPDFRVECPTGSGRLATLDEVADELRDRLIALFLPDAQGHRPVFGTCEKFQSDPHFKDHVWFHEYFDGDTGRGVGASHQTGWTGLVANLIAELGAR